MSLSAAHIRVPEEMEALAAKAGAELERFFADTRADSPLELPHAYKNRDMLLVQRAMLSAMALTGSACLSRGSALLASPEGAGVSMPGLTAGEELSAYRYLPGNGSHRGDWVKTALEGGEFRSEFVPVRPLPRTDDWFENVWNDYMRRTGALD